MVLKLEGSISKSNNLGDTLKKVDNSNNSHTAGNLEYVKLLNNDLLTVRIGTPYGNVVKAAMSSDFGFRLGNNWNNLVPLNDIPLAGDISQGIGGIITSTLGASQFSLESLWMTSASWAGYEMPTFQVRLTFLNYSKKINLFEQLALLSEGMLPPDISYTMKHAGDIGDLLDSAQQTVVSGIESATDWLDSIVSSSDNKITNWAKEHNITQRLGNSLSEGVKQIGVEAPFGYGYDTKTSRNDTDTIYTPKKHTTFSLEIGNWFSANRLLLNTGDFEFSKEIAPNGSPLTMTCNVNFRPYRNISFKEFCGYFRLLNSGWLKQHELKGEVLRGKSWNYSKNDNGEI